eukprot:CAMPEP_0197003982 /NCGR_PEP_ID=MMETSP1380-20130617/16916_1 /TAXON_ID=5936 /ORGANISM="Euplotes crassus, Strain CT5" /LENGTH=267 /DNA_ID=CAMNT_0042422613 /DNA_START=126 /DNA_END=932 /DNA_ORIENTATION=+
MKMCGDKKTADFKEIRNTAMKKIEELETMKTNLKNIPEEEKKDTFFQFVQSQFTTVDREERTTEKVTMLHALAFNNEPLSLSASKRSSCMMKSGKKKEILLVQGRRYYEVIKSGTTPKRGNPNAEDEDGYSLNEGDGISSQPARKSTKGGGSAYPSLGPQPDLGIPDAVSNEESKSAGSSSDNDESGSDSSDEPSPPPKKKETYKPPPPNKPAKKGKTTKKGKEFYKAIELAKKHCRNCISNLGYNKVAPSIDEIEKALEILRELED